SRHRGARAGTRHLRRAGHRGRRQRRVTMATTLAPFWDDDPDSWDTAVLGGATLPGLARIDGLELGSKWDVKEAPGSDGATETYQGYTPSPFQLVLRIWLSEQWTEWLRLAPQFRPKP